MPTRSRDDDETMATPTRETAGRTSREPGTPGAGPPDGPVGPSGLRDLVLEAVELESADREAFLDARAAHDPALAAQVRRLARAWDEAATMLQHPTDAGPLAGVRGAGTPDDAIGTTVGPFLLHGVLGEGGFGVVYRAEQTEPVRRTVAVKLLKPGLASEAVIGRFEAERQALARLSHPAIAKMLDAGVSADGHPWFAMELVDGASVTEWCDTHRLDVIDRLQLMTRIGRAVQHAHQAGIMHRDLKPSNVLITSGDGTPEPRIIDFGIAKALDEPLSAAAVVTGDHRLVGTPRYMSPEQASLGRLPVDTRTDVYALGAILHELLAGGPLIPDGSLTSIGLGALSDAIVEHRHASPATALRDLPADTQQAIATARRTRPAALERFLQGDVGRIIAAATDPDPAQRYGTALAFVRDIERLLACQPIEARPPSRVYAMRRFARRHRVGVAAAGVVALAVTGGLVTSIVALGQARADRDVAQIALGEANDATDFLARAIESVDPELAGHDVRVAEILDGAVRELDTATDLRPATQARLRHVLGNAHRALGNAEEAETQYRAALQLRMELFGPDDTTTNTVRGNLATLLIETGRVDEGAALQETVVETLERTLGPDDPTSIAAVSNFAVLLERTGRFDEGMTLQRQAVERAMRVHGPTHPRTIGYRMNLANWLAEIGDEEAEPMLRALVDDAIEHLDADAPERIHVNQALGIFLMQRGRLDEAIPSLQASRSARERVLGPTHRDTLVSRVNLASALGSAGRYTDAAAELAAIVERVPVDLPLASDVVRVTFNYLLEISERAGTPTVVPAELWGRVQSIARTSYRDAGLGPEILNAFALLLIEAPTPAPEDAAIAIESAERAVSVARENEDDFTFGYLDTLGQTLSAAGQHEAALARFDEALASIPEPYESLRPQVEAHVDEARARQAADDAEAVEDADPGAP